MSTKTASAVRVIEQTHSWGDCTKYTASDGYRHCHCHVEIAAIQAGATRTCRHCN